LGALAWDEDSGFSCASAPCDTDPNKALGRRLFIHVSERTTVTSVFTMLGALKSRMTPVVVLR
jgi:hypothetical protein